MRAWVRFALVGAAGAVCLAGCGGGKSFTADEFVEEVNAQGVKLELGEPLFTEGENKELYAVELEQVAALPGEDSEHDHTAGSLSVYEDTDGADEEIASCQASADLLCFQASNIVVVLEGGGIESQQLGKAIEKLESE
jgi:hypothetical protein